MVHVKINKKTIIRKSYDDISRLILAAVSFLRSEVETTEKQVRKVRSTSTVGENERKQGPANSPSEM
jgi:hypothetical protein